MRLRGLNFEGTPNRGIYASGVARYFDSEGRAYRLRLSKLAHDVSETSKGAVIDRLSHIYDEIYIDEVQDLTGCDLHIVKQLMDCADIDVYMVGDVRQSVFDTNPQDPNLRQYRGVSMLDWFEMHRKSGLLAVQHNAETWRAYQAIADSRTRSSPPSCPSSRPCLGRLPSRSTTASSRSRRTTSRRTFEPSIRNVRDRVTTASEVDLPFHSFGKVKGLTFERVIIYPTQTITRFLTNGTELAPKTACGLYVAVTRARHSVAFEVPNPSATALRTWAEPAY